MQKNTSMGDEMRNVQENLRLSAGTIAKLNNELKVTCNELEEAKQRNKELGDSNKKIGEYENKLGIFSQEIERLNGAIEKKNQEINGLKGRLHEIDGMNNTIGTLQDKISKLVNENVGMDEEVKAAQENLRLSAQQNQKMMRELNEYRQRIEQNNQENEALKQRITKLAGENVAVGDELRSAQENLRLSANTQARLNKELAEYRSRIDANNSESETYKMKMQKLLQENSALGDEVRTSQENLRLSAGTISKLNNELKITCNQNEELKRRIEEMAKMI
jgi:chromosome segregation ATPase